MFPNRNIRYVRRRTVSALFFTLLLCWATVLAVSAADTNAPQSGLKTGIDASATSGQAAGDVKATATTDPLARPVSYGLRVLSAREEMVLSGLCGNEITVTRDDICRALNLSSVSAITLTALPDSAKGTLFVGAAGAAVGQTVPVEALPLLSFAAANRDAPCEATAVFTVVGSGYEITCRFCLLERINYTPTVALASSVSLEVMTYMDMPAQGSLSAYDPEGDEITYEITSYATHGRIRLTDRHTGAYLYTPDAGYVGNDEFRYVVRDRYGNYSTAATVSVRVHAIPTAVTFADTEGSTCAAAALRLGEAGIMNGIRVGGKDYFRPDIAVTRAEFIATAMNAAGISPDSNGFTDSAAARILSGYADAGSIPVGMRTTLAFALEKGYFAGKTGADGRLYLHPDEDISRAEAAVLLSNIIGYARNTAVNAFADADTIPTWSVPALSSLKALGLLCSPNNTAAPAGRMTRGETAVWLEKTMRLMGR